MTAIAAGLRVVAHWREFHVEAPIEGADDARAQRQHAGPAGKRPQASMSTEMRVSYGE